MNNKCSPSSTLLDGYEHENHSDCVHTGRRMERSEKELTVLLHEMTFILERVRVRALFYMSD